MEKNDNNRTDDLCMAPKQRYLKIILHELDIKKIWNLMQMES